jgi:hypothetical protein
LVVFWLAVPGLTYVTVPVGAGHDVAFEPPPPTTPEGADACEADPPETKFAVTTERMVEPMSPLPLPPVPTIV